MSHNSLLDLENLCKNVKNSSELSRFTHVDFDNFGKVEKNQVEEAIYAMMEKFRTTPLEIANLMPKSLYDIVEQKWHYCVNLERQIRESTLDQVMSELTKAQIAKVVKKYAVRFTPKYKAFNILQSNIEDVVKKFLQVWRLTYRLNIVKEGEPKPIEVKDDEEDDDKSNIVEEETKMNINGKETTKPE